MISQTTIEKVKEYISSKGESNPYPTNGMEAITIKESKMGNKYTASIAVGKVVSINPRYFETQGYVFNETFDKWDDSNLRIEPKTVSTTKGMSFVCGVFPDGLIRKVDEAKWDNKFNNVDDLLEILENL
jgi:hypothetical protein